VRSGYWLRTRRSQIGDQFIVRYSRTRRSTQPIVDGPSGSTDLIEEVKSEEVDGASEPDASIWGGSHHKPEISSGA